MELLSSLIGPVVERLVAFIASLGYWGIAIGMALESANIPLPSEVILPFGGYLASTGRLSFFGAAMAGTLGGTVGSIISYFLGLWGGRPFLLRYGRYLGINRHHLELAERWFYRYGEATVFFTRLLPVVRTFISLPAGVAAMNFPRFVLYTFLGSLPWSFFLTYLGFKMGQHWEDLRFWFHRFDLLLLLVAAAAVAFYVWRKMRS